MGAAGSLGVTFEVVEGVVTWLLALGFGAGGAFPGRLTPWPSPHQGDGPGAHQVVRGGEQHV